MKEFLAGKYTSSFFQYQSQVEGTSWFMNVLTSSLEKLSTWLSYEKVKLDWSKVQYTHQYSDTFRSIWLGRIQKVRSSWRGKEGPSKANENKQLRGRKGGSSLSVCSLCKKNCLIYQTWFFLICCLIFYVEFTKNVTIFSLFTPRFFIRKFINVAEHFLIGGGWGGGNSLKRTWKKQKNMKAGSKWLYSYSFTIFLGERFKILSITIALKCGLPNAESTGQWLIEGLFKHCREE